MLIGKAIRDKDKSTLLVIPAVTAKKLQIEISKVTMLLLNNFSGNRPLVVPIFHNEIVIE